MFLKIKLLILFVHWFMFCDCFDDEWDLYENGFKSASREEIFIANATSNSNFKSNFTVNAWKTLTVGRTCYTGGITNDSMLVILYSTLSADGTGMDITSKIFDLQAPAFDFEFFHTKKKGMDKIFVVVYVPFNQEFCWYTLDHYYLNKVWNWSLEKNVSHFNLFKLENKNMFLAITTSNFGVHSADIYEFYIDPVERRFYQSILLSHATNSSCLNNVDSFFYLSIPQSPLNQLQIYQFSNNFFTPYQNLFTPKINQVVCFENGFKSFIAYNGLEAGIYEFTEDGLTKESIANSNFEGIQFWLPIPVNTYRDETILLCQRTLDHETHFSIDVDVVTYNGNRFEEHEDVPCLLFGEEQNGLKCLTDYDPKTGILGSSYIAIADHLSLVVPVTNGTSLLFDLNVDIRKVEHPAKKEFEIYLDRKDMLQTMIEQQNKEQALLIEQTKRVSNHNTEFKKKFQSVTTDSLLKTNLNEKPNLKILELRDEIEQVVKDIEDLNKKAGNGSSLIQTKDKYKKIIFNGPVEIVGELLSKNINSTLVGGEPTGYLLGDIVRKDQFKSVEGHKTFADLTADHVNFENINGVLSSNFALNNDNGITIDGDLIFTKLVDTENVVTTSKLVNGINITEQWVNLKQNIKGPLEFEQLKARKAFNTKIWISQENAQNSTNLSSIPDEFNDKNQESIFIPGNVTVNTLNGHNFESFLRKICLKTVNCRIPILKVIGVINCRGSTQIADLNNIKFPEDYVNLESTEEVLDITGFKDFTNITKGYKVITENKVNGIDLSKIITRSDEQNLSGIITFDDLEVASVLKVDGDVKGEGLEKFVPNVGLKETKVIKANVNFLSLEVQGNIIIENNFNGTDFNKYFEDFVLRDEENVIISGNKSFQVGFTALKNLHIDSNMINDISLNSIITKDSSQDLQITTISGPSDIEHLYVTGYFDGEDISELNNTLVKLLGNQAINSELVFLENVNVENFAFKEIKSLNPVEKSKNNEINLTNATDTIFDNLEVETLEIEGNIIGVIDQFDLKEFEKNYLRYTKDQVISQPYFVHKLTLDYLQPNKINNAELDNTFSYKKFSDNVTDFLMYRNSDVENLNIEGSIYVKTVNDRNFNELIKNDAWMKLYHNGSSKFLTIDGDVYFETLQIQNLADADFERYVSNLIFKNETDVNIENSIIFENGINVKKIIETKTLNDVALENILRKGGGQTLLGPIKIFGNVRIKDDLKVKDMVNNVDVKYISDYLDIKDNITAMRGEVMFNRLAYIHNLIINGTINERDFDRVKSKFVYANGDIDLEKDTLFNEMVHINGNFGITNDINGIILSDFVSKVVWITQDTEIQGPIRFTRPVECFEFMNVDKELNTQFLFGKNLQEHVDNGVFVNTGLLKGVFNFDNIAINENLNTKYINNLNMENIVPLKSDQEIETLQFAEIFISHNTDVGGEVNGVKLKKELQRTALKNIHQEIPSEVVFLNNVLIEDNLITSKINNKKASKMVTTNTDQNLTAVYNFNTKSWADSNLLVHGLINGINLTFWKKYGIATNKDSQIIKEKWIIAEDLNLLGPVSGDGIMNGINITKLVNDIQEKERYVCDVEKGIFQDYKNLCTDVTYIYENSKNQIYKFKYFEELQKISFDDTIHYVKYFEDKGKHFLLMNEYLSCISHLMEFRQNGFFPVRDVHTGVISQVEVVKDKEDTFLVTRGEDTIESTCKIRFSSVVWRFTRNLDLQVLAPLENQELLQESLIPLTFYGVRHGIITEFKINNISEIHIRRYRTWNVTEDNVAFFPRGLKTGLTLRTGKNIIFLNRNDPVVEDDFGIDTEAIINGTFTTDRNSVVPGRVGGVVTITNVGVKGAKKRLLAVASHKKARVEHRLDIIEIYIDPFSGELFDKIPTYRPSCLTSIEFENGETLLVFMEEQKVLQIYEYKGIEGFRHRSSIKIAASELFLMDLPAGENLTPRKVLGLIYKNEITLLQAIMVGNKIQDDLTCRI